MSVVRGKGWHVVCGKWGIEGFLLKPLKGKGPFWKVGWGCNLGLEVVSSK